MSYRFDFLVPGFPVKLHGTIAGCPASSGISTDHLAQALIGSAKPAGYDIESRYERRALPHFRQHPKASKRKRGR